MPVGVAGFHGAPDETGSVEIGYRVDPEQRRRSYARRSVEILMAEARRHPDVQTIRATMSSDNLPSIALVTAYGFAPNGEQWDEEDGLETTPGGCAQ
jgi:ribosomal-protein-alanine N-acetyltransferase